MPDITTIAGMQIVPTQFTSYVLERATAKSALVRSGVCIGDPRVATLINGQSKGGNFVSLPFFKALSGEDEVFGEGTMTPGSIETGSQLATLLVRQKAWSDSDLAQVYSGADPMSAIIDQVSDWWVAREQAVFLACLKGITGGSTAALKDHVLDISTAEGADAIIGVDATLDAKNLMGDAADKLGAICMHSATLTALQKQQVIDTQYNSDLKVDIRYYLGYEVIVDDTLPVSGGVYTTYLLGKGAFIREDGQPAGLKATEPYRDALSSTDGLINRRAFVLHPNGFAFNSAATFEGDKHYAGNADLSKVSNWKLVADHKNCPIVAIKHRVTVAPKG